MLGEFLSVNVFDFVLIFARVGAAVMLAPAFSAAYFNERARLAVAMALSFVMLPVIGPRLPDMPTEVGALAALVVSEVVIGALLGTVAATVLALLQVTGTVMALVSSLANAFIQDPVSQVQSSILSNFLSITAITMIMVTDLHHLMIMTWVDSYHMFLPGQMFPAGDMAMMMTRLTSDIFIIGVNLAAPFLIIGLTYYVGIGLLSRLMPTLPVFFFGLPIQIGLQLFTMSVALPVIMLSFMRVFQERLSFFLAP